MLKRLLPLLGLCGCGGADPGPAWTSLARGFEAPDPTPAVSAWRRPGGGAYGISLDDDGGFWVERAIASAEWKREAERAGFFSVDRTLLGLAEHSATSRTRLVSGALEFQTVTGRDAAEQLAAGKACYFLMPSRLLIGLPEGMSLPEEVVFGAHCDLGYELAGAWRARSGFLTADGVPLLSGQVHESEVELLPGSRLGFGTVALGVERAARLRFQVLLDDRTLLDHVQDATAGIAYHTLDLDGAAGDAGSGRRLRLVVSGDPGVGTFVAPWIGPQDASAAQRRPHIVLFLADTFRADNLELYGGSGELAPAVDDFARSAVRFHGARSPASWTLPAMSSLLTGLYPPQHGAQIEAVSMSPELTTLAEHLARHGYRTGAVTDSGFVAADYGMDQGFEIFQEVPAVQWSLEKTLRWSLDFLARDDGRPAFLLVHTYRTHYPYRQGAEEDFSAWIATLKRAGIDDWKTGRPPEELMPYAQDFRELYEDGVRAFDQAFDGWWEELRRSGWAERGYLLFTSDHGEAFGEHVEFGHGGQLWEEKIRIPLLLHGPGLAARDEHRSASLVDLAATLTALARVPPDSGWEGMDLLDLREDRSLLSYNEGVLGDHLAIVRGTRKVLTVPDAAELEQGRYDAAFDLAQDPSEQDDLAPEAPDWARELCGSHAGRVRELAAARAAAREAELSGAKQDELRAIGYGGD